jgi:hypothetical protein
MEDSPDDVAEALEEFFAAGAASATIN